MQCVTLLSDFGLHDATVASARGILAQYIPEAAIIDITHTALPFHLQQAAYLLQTAYENFPKGSCHVVLCDIFSEKTPRLLFCEKDGYYFLAPDNGILPLVFGEEIPGFVKKCLELSPKEGFRSWLQNCGQILATLLQEGADKIVAERCEIKIVPQHWRPILQPDSIECHVIHIDRFENVVINLTKSTFENVRKERSFQIQFMRNEVIETISNTYAEVSGGNVLCRFNTAGFMELCINRGKAASLLGLKIYNGEQLIYNTIKIHFGSNILL